MFGVRYMAHGKGYDLGERPMPFSDEEIIAAVAKWADQPEPKATAAPGSGSISSTAWSWSNE
jgi:hypothetical protein